MVRRAADEAGDEAELWDTMQRTRRIGAGRVVECAASFGPLRHDEQRAIEILWIYSDPSLSGSLVLTCDWPEPDYTA